ncbi:FHA domain-containing protein [Nocardia terpenica]|uniref:FHA domain-containing protein n=1 Tax=Nocardia terpenica TaxID=455432 RepID=UPI00031A9140|nr:FHA domain-containing protein [Nocardia terpenica]NQE87913.1 FHA domain-containing protein [Nocardia terpenica]
MVSCPDGHLSTATDYCDVCGTAIGPVTEAAAPSARCPACDSPIDGRFCEVCGHDSALPAPVPEPSPAPTMTAPPTIVAAAEGNSNVPPVEESANRTAWVAIVTADREFYERVRARKGPDADRVEFPDYYPQRRIGLQGTDFLIGKRSVSQGVYPDIDLGIPPVDIGVSRSHARIHLDGDTVTVTDLGSTNGTSLNGSDDLIPPHTPIPLHPDDRIHVGGWTTITVTRGAPGDG